MALTAKQQQLINDMLDTIDGAVTRFDGSISDLQDAAYLRIADLINEMDTSNGSLRNNIRNSKAISSIRGEILSIILNKKYKSELKDFVKAFDQITGIGHEYYGTMVKRFSPPAVIEQIKKNSVDFTIDSLTESGLDQALAKPVAKMLNTAITSGGSVKQLQDQLKEYMTDTETSPGRLSSYTKGITTDALNQYNGNYNATISADLGLEWVMYVGSLIKTSRDFCEACIKKKWIHISELPNVVAGNFAEFKAIKGTINPRTGLPAGMIAGTNASNFIVYRGGYGCGHSGMYVAVQVVPKVVVLAIPRSRLSKASLDYIDGKS